MDITISISDYLVSTLNGLVAKAGALAAVSGQKAPTATDLTQAQVLRWLQPYYDDAVRADVATLSAKIAALPDADKAEVVSLVDSKSK